MKPLKTIAVIVLTVFILMIAGTFVFGMGSGEGHNKNGEGCELVKTTEIDITDIHTIKFLYKNCGDNIFIQPGKADKIIFREYQQPGTGEEKCAKISSGNCVMTIEGRTQKFPKSYLGMDAGEGYVVMEVPAILVTDWEAETSSGNISIEEMNTKAITFTTKSGNISVTSIVGSSYQITTTSGNFMGRDMKGQLNFSTSSGNMTATNVNGQVWGRTMNGNIDLEMASVNHYIQCNSVNGNISITLPKEVPFSLKADTIGGLVDTFWEEGLTFNKRMTKVEGTYGSSPSYSVDVKSTSGNVSIR